MLRWIWRATLALLISFSGSMAAQVRQPTQLPASPTQRGLVDADPVSISTGIYYRVYKDLFVKDTIPIDFMRTPRNMDPRSRSFGVGGSTSYDMFIIGDVKKFSWVALVLADGGQVRYSRISPGTGVLDGVFEDQDDASEFLGSRITWNEEFYRDNLLKWTLEYGFVPQTHKRLNITLSCGSHKTSLPPAFAYKIGQLGEAHKPFVSEMCRHSATAKPSAKQKKN